MKMNTIIYRNKDVSEKSDLIERINHMMKIPADGIYILFDDSDYEDHPNAIFRKQAFHMNIKVGGVEEMSPEHILAIMDKPDCEHFVWVSKRIGKSEHIHFAWVYSHELQHLLRDISCHKLSIVGHFLNVTYGLIDPKVTRYYIDIPTEFDCDRRAKGIVTEIFGQEKCDRHILNQGQNPDRKDWAERMQDVEPSALFDVERETLDLLCQHKEPFKAQQRYLCKEEGMFCDLDIEEICAKRSLGNAI